MRVLYLTTPGEDYLQDGLLYGLRKRLGADLVDWPRKDVMYENCAKPTSELYGRGFTMWKLLPDIAIDRPPADATIHAAAHGFDLLVFASIRRQRTEFAAWNSRRGLARFTDRPTAVFLDGEDKMRLLVPAVVHGKYYKRERTRRTATLTRPISFSIPSEKLVLRVPREKPRRFATHVQCDEAYRVPWIAQHCERKYAFDTEDAYRRDLQSSLFGLTMKKAGWDCMRHYEVASNGCVPCFWRLSEKPKACAPFGLVDGVNCVDFTTAEELDRRTLELEADPQAYARIAQGALEWAREHACEAVADRWLASLAT
ncbi:MAG: glycosyltransferase family 1 protein [Planctomycetes bacterium]|nr:glycosyltransferase family 1 protein [Planctomycetota bacterium]MCB9905294.1 glycosyltransferase family 1 protein [Planctomycetota bacterium]